MQRSVGVRIGLILAVLIVPLWLRTIYEARQFVIEAQDLQSPEREQMLRRAVSWRSPLNLYSSRAAEELKTQGFDQKKDEVERLLALDALQRGLSASRSLITSSALQEEVNQELAKLRPLAPVQEVVSMEPRFFRQLLVQIFFWIAIFAFALVALRGFDEKAKANWQAITRYGSIGLASFVLWMLGLAFA